MRTETSGQEFATRILPLFPLPDTVLFPGTSLKLHVFESRYRAMVRDVTSGEGLIVVSLIAGDGFRGLGSVGRIRELEQFEDGGFDLRLEGLQRVSLTEVPGDTPYRRVLVQARPECMGTDDTSAIDAARLESLAGYAILRSMIFRDEKLVLNQHLPFELAVNAVCACLPIDASLRQRLLTEDSLIERQRLGLDYLYTAVETLSWLRAMKDNVSSLIN